MNRTDAYQGESGGPIAFMASNRVAANLLMFGILAAGPVSLLGLERDRPADAPSLLAGVIVTVGIMFSTAILMMLVPARMAIYLRANSQYRR